MDGRVSPAAGRSRSAEAWDEASSCWIWATLSSRRASRCRLITNLQAKEKEEGRRKREEGRNKNGRGDDSPAPFFPLPFSFFPCSCLSSLTGRFKGQTISQNLAQS